MLYGIITTVTFLIVVGLLFIQFSPQFGGKHSSKDKNRYKASGHYKNGIFVNLISTSMDLKGADMLRTMKDFIIGVPHREPLKEIEVSSVDSMYLEQDKAKTKLIWFGHSAFLLQLDNKNILIDPMLGPTPSPHPWLGGKRYSKELPIEIEKLPQIDAIVLSHDHYDHLDYESIQKLKDKTKHFYVPLGVGAHLRSWRVNENQISELNWWDEKQLDDIKLAFTPSRHFSGRGLTDRSTTMWGSWVFLGQQDSIYFSGDSGYGPHFKEIGNKYGPFDFAMMECGQYNEKWSQIHMMPEETAQASVDVKAKLMMPIHWGAFSLALHTWTDPVERLIAKANELNQPYITPEIGQIIRINSNSTSPNWWLKFD